MRKLPPKDGTKALTQVEPRLNRHTAGLVPPRTVRAGGQGIKRRILVVRHAGDEHGLNFYRAIHFILNLAVCCNRFNML